MGVDEGGWRGRGEGLGYSRPVLKFLRGTRAGRRLAKLIGAFLVFKLS